MLAWLARHLPFLRAAPGLPALLDALLLGWTALRRPARLAAMHRVEAAVLAWPDTATRAHRFGGAEFTLHTARGRREIGHLHGHGLLDVPFPRAVRDALVASGAARPHHIFPRSGWVSYFVRSPGDVPGALALLRRSYDRWQALDAPAPADVL